MTKQEMEAETIKLRRKLVAAEKERDALKVAVYYIEDAMAFAAEEIRRALAACSVPDTIVGHTIIEQNPKELKRVMKVLREANAEADANAKAQWRAARAKKRKKP